MSFSRRTFLIGAGTGASLLVLAACSDPTPGPKPTPTVQPTNTLPSQSAFFRSNWSADPYARGATSYLPVGGLPQARESLREPVLDRVFIAGEAVSDEPGTIRGALTSGAVAARAVLDVMDDGERIAVIGAGAAGAEAARVLAATGVDVVVIEARDRTGGRIDSRVADDVHRELGAWRLAESADTEIIERLDRTDVEVSPLAGGSAFATVTDAAVTEIPADDPFVSAAAEAFAGALVWGQEQPEDVAVADAVVGSGAAPESDGGLDRTLVVDQLLVELSTLTGADAADLTSWYLQSPLAEGYVVPTGPLVTLVDSALEGVDTYLSTVVVAVFYDETRVSLRLGTGESIAVDRVILTAPLGVLQEQGIEFDPVLPLRHRSALGQLAVGDVELVRLEFDEPFWETEAVLWFREDTEETIRLWINLLPVTGENALLGVVGGEAALTLAGLDDQEVLDAARASLAPFV